MKDFTVRDVVSIDQNQLCAIANYYIDRSFASFYPTTANKKYFDGLVKMTKKHAFLALEHEGRLVGYAFLSAFKPSSLFERSAKVGIFLHHEYTGRKLGALLMDHLIEKARTLGLENLISSIASPNEPSLKFHLGQGFVECGRLLNVGRKFGRCFDEVLMQKQL